MSDPHPAVRRALVMALCTYLPPEQAARAAAQWQPGAGSVTAGLSRYCRAMAQQFGLQGREAEMHLDIIRAMRSLRVAGGSEVREEAPTSGLARVEPGVSANDSVPAGLSAMAVQRFLEAAEQCVARELPDQYSAVRWRQSLEAHARRLQPALLQPMMDWLWGRTPQLVGDWPARGAGTRLINIAYVALADWLGPVRADACFTGIVREFEGSHDAVLAGVRRYL